MGAAKVRVTLDLLRELMHFPDGTRIHRAEMVEFNPDEIELTVTHADIPAHQGCDPPLASPVFHHQRESITLEDWGVK